MSAWTKTVAYFRGADSSPAERKLVLKLDFFILTFCCMAYFMNYLDRQSLSQAYVSGMKEDLNMGASTLTYINTVYACGYLVGIVPNNLMLTYFKPRNFFPLMITIWGLVTMTTAAAKNSESIMGIRFIQGYFESCTFAGTHYLLGSWYTEKELGKRSGLFTASGLAGGIFGGLLQAAIYSSINGKGGLTGWRIDGLITLPIAAYGYFLFPDTPRLTTAFYFSAEEKALAIARVPESPPKAILTMAFFKKVVTSWPFWAFAVLWTITNCSEQQSTSSLLQLYMKSAPSGPNTYTVVEKNYWPTGVQAVGIVSTLFWATVTDIFGMRWMAGYYISFTAVVSAIIILIPSTTPAGIFGAYYWAGSIYACQATFFAWANDEMRHEDDATRSVTIAFMNFAGNTFNAFWPLIFYNSSQAPYFTRGMYCMIVIGTLLAIWTTVILVTFRRIHRKLALIEAEPATSVDGSIGMVEESVDDKMIQDRKLYSETA
ncbi:retrograde regulation protein 2-2 [Coleophoma cylindrospora]|uniref:Retrograde regulation protein 2-2 n=1 Tax=Coleophoma cylindrospora TaxID=1849047 RepID=A0A3D8S9P6_9HELO|nr:retrograde regulation protein 2-2 [Coleophoma cylindrospora]